MKVVIHIPCLIGLTILFSCGHAITYDLGEEIPQFTQINSRTIKGEHHYIRGYSPIIDSTWIRMVVEIPAGSVAKWEVNKSTGYLNWETRNGSPRKVKYLGYPGNYGMIPQTLLPKSAGGDGDPLDILCLGPAAERGSVIPVRLLGILKLLDHGEQDDKLIALPDLDEYASIHTMDELNEILPGSTSILKTWFSHYKGNGIMEFKGFGDQHEARQVLDQALKSYR